VNEVLTRPAGRIVWYFDDTPNDGDKTFTVPSGKYWILKSIYFKYVASDTVGRRALVVWIKNSEGKVMWYCGEAGIDESQYARVQIANGIYNNPPLGASANKGLSIPLDIILPPGSYIHIYDYNGTDPAADDLTVGLHYIEVIT